MTEQRLVCSVFVPGRARTKGHLEPVHVRGVNGKPCTFGGAQDRPLAKAWLKTLIGTLRRELGIEGAMRTVLQKEGPSKRKFVRTDAEPYAGAVEVHAFFRFDRQESVQGGAVPSQGVPWPVAPVIGDEDTLRRAVLDALTQSGVLADDRLSVGGMNYKRWCEPGEVAGVQIVVLTAPDPVDVWALEQVAMNAELL